MRMIKIQAFDSSLLVNKTTKIGQKKFHTRYHFRQSDRHPWLSKSAEKLHKKIGKNTAQKR